LTTQHLTGQLLREVRLNLNLSLRDASTLSTLAVNTIRFWEEGTRVPMPATREQLLKTYSDQAADKLRQMMKVVDAIAAVLHTSETIA
jgi:transcriptional regulator with XRE-family HTH domain